MSALIAFTLVTLHALGSAAARPSVALRVMPAVARGETPILSVTADPATSDASLRVVVRRAGPRGKLLAVGEWVEATSRSLQLPPDLYTNGIVGVVSVTAELVDAAGGNSTSEPVMWSVVPPGHEGTATVVTHVMTDQPLVAITVDDGRDHAPEAMQMIRAARDAGATITFCFNANANWPLRFRDAVSTAVKDGVLEVCNHGHSHNTSRHTTKAEGLIDLEANAEWDQIAGVSTRPFYRPPFGYGSHGLREAAAELGYRFMLLWDTSPQDWKYDWANGTATDTIVQRAVGGARNGSIILLHALPDSANALPGIYRGLVAKGLKPVGVSELLSAGPPGVGRKCSGQLCVDVGAGKAPHPLGGSARPSGHRSSHTSESRHAEPHQVVQLVENSSAAVHLDRRFDSAAPAATLPQARGANGGSNSDVEAHSRSKRLVIVSAFIATDNFSQRFVPSSCCCIPLCCFIVHVRIQHLRILLPNMLNLEQRVWLISCIALGRICTSFMSSLLTFTYFSCVLNPRQCWQMRTSIFLSACLPTHFPVATCEW
jgi:peptidoglycan/xylan/chitin deacetylase (PgdA/CDA1 family)